MSGEKGMEDDALGSALALATCECGQATYPSVPQHPQMRNGVAHFHLRGSHKQCLVLCCITLKSSG